MIAQFITAVITKLIELAQWIFNQIFGNWNWQILFTWVPQDIIQAATYFILILFCIAVIKVIRSLLPI